MNTNQSNLATGKITVLMRAYALPCILSLLIGALYNIVDQIFIANTPALGSFGNAANTVVFPLTVIALAIAVMIGDGCCAFLSLSLGRNAPDKANRSTGNAVMLCIVLSLALTFFYLGCSRSVLGAFGGAVNERTMRLSEQYFFYITLGIPFYMFGQMMNPIIRADGHPRYAMIASVSGALVNIVLDPLFLFGFDWGMAGAAIATILGQLLTFVLSLAYMFRMQTVTLDRSCFVPDLPVLRSMLELGITSFLSQISLVMAMAVINRMIVICGAADPIFSQIPYAQIPMAVVGIVMKFFQIVISIVIGMAAGCIPIVGFNMGAGLEDRVRMLLRQLLLGEMLVGMIAFVIAELFPSALIQLFGAAQESVYYTEFAVRAFRIYLSMIVLACVNKATFIFLQAMGKAVESTMLSLVRELVFGIGFAWLLPQYFGLNGVLLSMPVSDILTGVLSAIVLMRTFRSLSANRKPAVQE